jgi:hypothetical protein
MSQGEKPRVGRESRKERSERGEEGQVEQKRARETGWIPPSIYRLNSHLSWSHGYKGVANVENAIRVTNQM